MNVVPFDRAASDEATPSISSGSQQPRHGSARDLHKRIRSLAERGKVRAVRCAGRNVAVHRAIAGCETMRVTRAWLHKESAQEGGCLASPHRANIAWKRNDRDAAKKLWDDAIARCELIVKQPGGNPRAAKLLERIRDERKHEAGPARDAASSSPSSGSDTMP